MKHMLTPAFVADLPVPLKDRTFYWEGSFGRMVTARAWHARSFKQTARDRVLLCDDELRAVWRAAEAFFGPCGYLPARSIPPHPAGLTVLVGNCDLLVGDQGQDTLLCATRLRPAHSPGVRATWSARTFASHRS